MNGLQGLFDTLMTTAVISSCTLLAGCYSSNSGVLSRDWYSIWRDASRSLTDERHNPCCQFSRHRGRSTGYWSRNLCPLPVRVNGLVKRLSLFIRHAVRLILQAFRSVSNCRRCAPGVRRQTSDNHATDWVCLGFCAIRVLGLRPARRAVSHFESACRTRACCARHVVRCCVTDTELFPGVRVRYLFSRGMTAMTSDKVRGLTH
jgi:hypothetical protein